MPAPRPTASLHGQTVQLAHGDIFYGAVEIDGESFMSRERAPFRDDIDLDELSYNDLEGVRPRLRRGAGAGACAVGRSRARSITTSSPRSSRPRARATLFIADIVRFAEEAADRLKADHACFREDHAHGAFDSIDMVYR